MRRFFISLITAVVVAIGLGTDAHAVPSVFHPELLRALDSLDHAEGPEAYAAVDRIWTLWDRADAAHVEEALLGASQNAKLSADARAYAAVLASFARARRGDQKASTERVRELGYISNFLVVGPFDNEGKSGLDQVFEPEAELTAPITPGRAYTGKERPVRYRAVTNAFPFGWLDASALVRPETKVCIYATAFVRDDKLLKGTRKIRAYIGAGGAFKLFWNGQESLKDVAYRGHDFDRSGVELPLSPGPNALVVKVCGEDDAPELSVRLADDKGAADPKLKTSIDIGDSQKAAERMQAEAKTATAKGAHKPTAPSKLAIGPVPLFERLVAGKQPRARDLESYARYLADTNGDDSALHLARDLSQRAADASPSIERFLLASRLAED
ncbi:MAG TPA: hypothetical protein VEQ59_06690, partial [Polyangiaceae bacterium]|nr:hypothetical protein [Polyangiaceae bacterium]